MFTFLRKSRKITTLRYVAPGHYVTLRTLYKECELVTLRYVHAALRYVGSVNPP